MIKVLNRGKTIINLGNIYLKPLQEIIVEDNDLTKINKANSLAKLGLVKITPYIKPEPEVKTVSIIEEIPVKETKSSKPKSKKKINKEK